MPDSAARPPPSSTSASSSGGRREDGLHRICSLFEPLALADSIEIEAGGEADEVLCPGVEGENLAARALAALREQRLAAPAAAAADREADPGRGGARRRQRRCGRGAAAGPGRVARAARRSRPSSGPTSPRSWCRRWPWSRAPGSGCGGCPIRAPHARCPAAGRRRAVDRRGLRRGRPPGTRPQRAELDAIASQAAGGGRRRGLRRSPTPSCSATTSSRPRSPCDPEIGEAISALREAGAGLAAMTGSGPTAFGLFADLGSAREAARAARPRRRDRLRGRGGAVRVPAGASQQAPRPRPGRRIAVITVYYLVSRLIPHENLQGLLEDVSQRARRVDLPAGRRARLPRDRRLRRAGRARARR